MKTMYRAEVYPSIQIVAVDIDQETDGSVWFRRGSGLPLRVVKETERYKYSDTWAEAHAWLVSRAEVGIQIAQKLLDEAKDQLGNVKEVKQ